MLVMDIGDINVGDRFDRSPTSSISYQLHSKRGCVFPMVLWPEFRMGQYRVNDHHYHAPQFNKIFFILEDDKGMML